MNKKGIVFLILVIIWMGVIYIYSDKTSEKSNSESTSIVSGVINKIDSVTNASTEKITKHQSDSYINDVNTIFRKICHGIVYMALAVLIFNFLINTIKSKLLVYNLICILISFIYASLDEYHQTFIIGRTGSFIDILIDTLGATVGCLLVSIVYITIKRKNKYKYL